MKEKWICPNMDVQVFTPQEFVAACELIVIGRTIIVNSETEAFMPGIHMILDINEDKLWTTDDQNQQPDMVYTSDNNQPAVGSTLNYTGMGWALIGHGNIHSPSTHTPTNPPTNIFSDTSTYMYAAAFSKDGASNMHIYAADWEEIWAKNQS